MKKLIPLTALVLSLSGGVALADRGHDHGGRATVDHRGGTTVVREHGNGNVVVRDNHNNWNRGDHNWDRGDHGRGNTVVVRDNHNYNRGNWNVNHGGGRVIVRNDRYYRPYYSRPYYSRRPIYVSRPIIREHYYNYYQRPSLILESYGPRAGYFWVAGAWSWDGAEWIWQPGHYQPDESYVEPAYDDGY